MSPDRKRQILAHLYGRNDGKLTVLPGRWGTAADGRDFFGNLRSAGCWITTSMDYWTAENELIITPAEAGWLANEKAIAWENNSVGAGATARGRDLWNGVRR